MTTATLSNSFTLNGMDSSVLSDGAVASPAPPSLDFAEYRAKALGCWLGKAVGGTLGGPFEGHDGSLDLSFYQPMPTEMLPNDDLDLQVVWLESLRRFGLPVHRRMLSEAWLRHIRLLPDEYGVACRNLEAGLYPPASGSFDNPFVAGMGAAIRTEIWACLAPGDPHLAAKLAREDGCVDHAGEGVEAAVYLAALQSLAFVESDVTTLLDAAATFITSTCRVARAIADTRKWWAQSGDYRAIREQVLEHHGNDNFTDVAPNLAFIILGWLAGEGDFGKALCIAVNCGLDTDCTGATLGALLGILDPQGIGEEWLSPIGRDLVLSPGMVGMHAPPTLDEFTDEVAALALAVDACYGAQVKLKNAPDEAMRAAAQVSLRPCLGVREDWQSSDSLLAAEPLRVELRYPPQIALTPGQTASLLLRITNPTSETLSNISLDIKAPLGWDCDFNLPEFFALEAGQAHEIDLSITPLSGGVRAYTSPLDLAFQINSLRFDVTAGMVLTTPFLLWPQESVGEAMPRPPATAHLLEVAGHSVPLPEEAYVVRGEWKMPYTLMTRFVVQAPGRSVRVWIDGELVMTHNGVLNVPAIHRAEQGTTHDRKMTRGEHQITIAVGAGDSGALFIGIAEGQSWDWLRSLEWRRPSFSLRTPSGF